MDYSRHLEIAHLIRVISRLAIFHPTLDPCREASHLTLEATVEYIQTRLLHQLQLIPVQLTFHPTTLISHPATNQPLLVTAMAVHQLEQVINLAGIQIDDVHEKLHPVAK
jgi:hypothetical protein